MTLPARRDAQTSSPLTTRDKVFTQQPINRINSRDLFRQMREVEIAHEGRIYRLRVTQLNKLILTA